MKSIAISHLKSLNILKSEKHNDPVLNLRSGKGYSVMEIISACKDLIDPDLKFALMPRRAGDPSLILADITKFEKLFGVNPEDDLEKIIMSGWNSWKEKTINVK